MELTANNLKILFYTFQKKKLGEYIEDYHDLEKFVCSSKLSFKFSIAQIKLT